MENLLEHAKVRLKVSGQSVDPSCLPENLIISIANAFSGGTDPFAMLATFAYIFCGLKINDIKDMIILSDRSGTRTASREYIRQKIVTTFHLIQKTYVEEHGATIVAPIFKAKNLDPTEVSAFMDDKYEELFEEDSSGEGYEDQTEEAQEVCKESGKDKKSQVHTGGTGSGGPEKGDDNEHRPGYSASWLVNLKNRLHSWWEPA